MARSRTSVVPEFFPGSTEEHLRVIAQSVNGLLRGKGNNVETVTLTTDNTKTELTIDRITADTVATLTPQTASAAAAMGALWVETKKDTLTINHDSSSDSDRTFGVTLVG